MHETLHDELAASRIDSFAGMHVPWLLDQWVARSPDKPFLVWVPFTGDPETWTYARFAGDVRRVAAGLHARGVRPGDFVIIHLDNSPAFLLSWFACAELGAVAVSTNTRSVDRDLAYFADHVSAVGAITQPAHAAMIRRSCPDIGFLVVTADDAGEPADVDPAWDAIAFADLFVDEPGSVRAELDHLANLSVQFTSGTTSRPKAVLWTHANALWCGKVCSAHMQLRRDDRTLIFLPLFHTNAQGYSMLGTLWSGGTIVVQPRFSASRFWPVSVDHEVTWVSTIPFAFKAVADQPVPDHHYRLWGTAAYIPAIEQHIGVDVMGWWGMTETLTHGIVTDPHHPGPPLTIGRVAPEYDIQIRRPDGTLAEPGERGHLFIRGVRGVSLFKEYYRNPEANDAAFDEHGWFDTGDVIRIDDDGWLFFSDRDKDMLKVGAENVAASEIEAVIAQSGLSQEAAVVGQPHPMLDEVPVAFVIPAPGAGDDVAQRIIDHCAENLADFKVPRSVVLVDELPRSTLEKIAKAELRARLPEWRD